MNTWATYVRTVTGEGKLRSIADRVGVHYTTVSGWLNGRYTPDAGTAIAFARAYDLDPTQALLHAGFLTEDEVEGSDLQSVPVSQIIAELNRRVLLQATS